MSDDEEREAPPLPTARLAGEEEEAAQPAGWADAPAIASSVGNLGAAARTVAASHERAKNHRRIARQMGRLALERWRFHSHRSGNPLPPPPPPLPPPPTVPRPEHRQATMTRLSTRAYSYTNSTPPAMQQLRRRQRTPPWRKLPLRLKRTPPWKRPPPQWRPAPLRCAPPQLTRRPPRYDGTCRTPRPPTGAAGR